LVYTIWNRVLRFDPQDPIWPDRDRFVLSNGHALDSDSNWHVVGLCGSPSFVAFTFIASAGFQDRTFLLPT